MNTKAYFELAHANIVGRTAASLFERIDWWVSKSKLIHDGKTFCFRTYEQLAEEIGVSVSTARRAVARLVDLGWLEKLQLKAKNWNQTNCYTFGPNAPENASNPRAARSVHSDSHDSSKMDGSINKKGFIRRKIQDAQAKVHKMAQGFGKSFRGEMSQGGCRVCNSSGIVSDEHNNGFRCLCADGRSKSAQIPGVSQELFMSLRAQISAD